MKRMNFVLLALVLVMLPGIALSNLVTNPGFETGDFTGWTQSGNTGATFVGVNDVHSGTYAAALGPVGSLGFLSQDLATEAGTYTLSFWLTHDGGEPAEFQVIWGGNTIFDTTDPSFFPYTLKSFDVAATGATTTLTFGFREDPNYYHLDDVSVEAVAAPEPATMFLLGSGLVGLAAYGRKKLRK